MQFHGRRDNAEDPRGYIQDIEYEIKLEKRHYSDPSYDWDEDRCILFHQNLRDKAELWYSQLNRNTKDNWAKLKEEFIKWYQIDEVDAATRRFQVSQRVEVDFCDSRVSAIPLAIAMPSIVSSLVSPLARQCN